MNKDHYRVGAGKCKCGFDAYKFSGIMLDYHEMLMSHLRTAPEQDRESKLMASKPYTSSELIQLATDIRGPQPLDPMRVLATYADPSNWQSVHARDDRGPRHYWSWNGPTIVGYELAARGVRDGDERLSDD